MCACACAVVRTSQSPHAAVTKAGEAKRVAAVQEMRVDKWDIWMSMTRLVTCKHTAAGFYMHVHNKGSRVGRRLGRGSFCFVDVGSVI